MLAVVAVATGLLPASHNASAAESGHTALPKLAVWTGDYDVMQRKRVIRVLVPYSKTIFFIDKGEQFGTAAEWGSEFEEWVNKGKKSEIERMRIAFVPTPRDKLLDWLNQGRGDVVAANLTITPDRLAVADFTDPVLKNVREVLVTGPSAPDLANIEDLSGKELYVRKSSSYYEHLLALNNAWRGRNLKPFKLTMADENLEDEDLLEMVNAGILPFAVVDDYKGQIWAKIFKSLKVRDDIVISDNGAVAAAIRKNSPQLKAVLNKFVAEKSVTYGFASWLRKRYYTDDKMVHRAYAPQDMQRFRQLIAYFRRYGDQYSFDYLMITAQGYQESKLDQAERNKSGAVGIMQIKPSTARETCGCDRWNRQKRGTQYRGRQQISAVFDHQIHQRSRPRRHPPHLVRLAGPGGLKKFRDKARAMGLDPNVWFGSVENAAAAVVGRETVQYVSNIYKYYIAYALLTRQVDGETGSAKKKESAQ